jgi:tRNA threonylcarbamoyladenosine biosynthesis protein TsaE
VNQARRGEWSASRNPSSERSPALIERTLVTHDADETRALGARLGSAAEAGDAFLLDGEFGSGKTVLVQGLADGLGVQTFVASPSFVIVNQHQGRLPLYHVDLYRAERLDPELEDTVADVLEAGGVTAIEWPRLLPPRLRRGTTAIRLSLGESRERILILRTPHDRLARAFVNREPDLDRLHGAEHGSARGAPGLPGNS